jgi:hypothetical protein
VEHFSRRIEHHQVTGAGVGRVAVGRKQELRITVLVQVGDGDFAREEDRFTAAVVGREDLVPIGCEGLDEPIVE